MPNSSSSTTIAFAQSPSDMRIAAFDAKDALRPSPGARFGVKEIQRRAFERGCEVTMQRLGTPLKALETKMKQLITEIGAAREADAQRMEEFAVRLGLEIAERLSGQMSEEGRHDARAIAEELLKDYGDPDESESLRLRCHPDDEGRLLELWGTNRPEGLVLQADPRLALGDMELVGHDRNLWSRRLDRLAAVSEALIEESRRG